ncbi:fgf-1 [Matsumuraeses phaseoli granulovirus]|uniref:Fgf-1 n=1 Tax=Matsumuraeses phaseoli granulovirus TaxID=2760664 RepID=A0AAE7SXP7_9BBAC|nr:fgf-1 [Matsumuraeses phaseoli granulovirus]QOD40029.1 fgf-1 [Matsumuraeses phaseoli granulovirus]
MHLISITPLLTIVQFVWSVSCVGTLHPANNMDHVFCIHGDNIMVRPKTETMCSQIEFNVHKHENNLVLNFKTPSGVCKYMCIDKCGAVYYNSVYHTEDCKLTTSSFDTLDTLSVHRGNYSDFVAFNSYMIPLSYKHGDSLERMYKFVSVKYNEINTKQTCQLMLTPSKTTQSCTETQERRGDLYYNYRKHYRDYSFWNKLLILVGYIHYVIPNNSTALSYIEYNNK